MTSPLKLRSGFPEAPRSCSPRWSTLSGERPCVSSDFWCCCFSFCSSAASGSCWTLTAACRRHRGRITRRVWTKDSLITRWCEEEGRGRRVNIPEELLHGDCFCGKTKVKPEHRNYLIAAAEKRESCTCNSRTKLKMSVLRLSYHWVDLNGCRLWQTWSRAA